MNIIQTGFARLVESEKQKAFRAHSDKLANVHGANKRLNTALATLKDLSPRAHQDAMRQMGLKA